METDAKTQQLSFRPYWKNPAENREKELYKQEDQGFHKGTHKTANPTSPKLIDSELTTREPSSDQLSPSAYE